MNKKILFISLVFGVSLLVVRAGYTQTDLPIKSAQADIEKEHRQELDQWVLRAYEGDRDAQFKVGVLFTNDQFNQPDYEQAVYWYKQAARQGHPLAQYNLGHQYLAGLGVQRSETEAMAWWKKAAEQDHALAQFNIGRGFYLGIGVEQDLKKSRFWFESAANNGETKSIEILQKISWPEDGADTTTALADINSKPAASVTDNTKPERFTPAPTIAASDNARKAQKKPQQPPKSDTAAGTANQSIEVFTDPNISSHLISVANSSDGINIKKRASKWTSISTAKGFPVWVHSNFISVRGVSGKITGNKINARSEPNIVKGTIVGLLNKGETLSVVENKGKWYRVISPARFTAWVKSKDLKALNIKSPIAKNSANNSVRPKTTATNKPQTRNRPNHDEWLFNQPPKDYTLQLANFDSKDLANQFLKEKKLSTDPNLRVFTSNGNDLNWSYYLYGNYAKKSAAKKAKKKLNLSKAWVRSFGKLQQNRCVTWKTQLPTPKELQTYCIK